jgi:hypothetical protein
VFRLGFLQAEHVRLPRHQPVEHLRQWTLTEVTFRMAIFMAAGGLAGVLGEGSYEMVTESRRWRDGVA